MFPLTDEFIYYWVILPFSCWGDLIEKGFIIGVKYGFPSYEDPFDSEPDTFFGHVATYFVAAVSSDEALDRVRLLLPGDVREYGLEARLARRESADVFVIEEAERYGGAWVRSL